MAETYTAKIAVCDKCGFIYNQNVLSQDFLDELYKAHSKFEYGNANIAAVYEANTSASLASSNYQFDFLNEYKDSYESIIEIGAANGRNLARYKQLGKKVLAIEPSQDNCNYAKDHYGIEMFAGMFDEYISIHENDNAKFDMLYLSHILEHIVNPFDFMKKATALTSKYVFIDVPSFENKFREEPYGMFCDEHVNYFTLESLYSIMGRLGFGLIKAQWNCPATAVVPAGFPAVATLWERGAKETIPNFRPLFSSSDIVKKYIDWSAQDVKRICAIVDQIPDASKIGVFGASNHTWKLLGYSNLKNKNIVKFYDSDIKKSHQKILGKPVQPFCESDIDDGIVDTIIISASVAQKSIYNMIAKYSNRINIIKLYDF